MEYNGSILNIHLNILISNEKQRKEGQQHPLQWIKWIQTLPQDRALQRAQKRALSPKKEFHISSSSLTPQAKNEKTGGSLQTAELEEMQV